MNDEETILVEYRIAPGRREEFQRLLEQFDRNNDDTVVRGYRAGDVIDKRASLTLFTDQMELVLRRHDHKTGWRERPIRALVELLFLEVAEFKVAFEHFEVSESRKELIDMANFCLICWDRLSMLDQAKTVQQQSEVGGNTGDGKNPSAVSA